MLWSIGVIRLVVLSTGKVLAISVPVIMGREYPSQSGRFEILGCSSHQLTNDSAVDFLQ